MEPSKLRKDITTAAVFQLLEFFQTCEKDGLKELQEEALGKLVELNSEMQAKLVFLAEGRTLSDQLKKLTIDAPEPAIEGVDSE